MELNGVLIPLVVTGARRGLVGRQRRNYNGLSVMVWLSRDASY
jgi:hypothetical protein